MTATVAVTTTASPSVIGLGDAYVTAVAALATATATGVATADTDVFASPMYVASIACEPTPRPLTVHDAWPPLSGRASQPGAVAPSAMKSTTPPACAFAEASAALSCMLCPYAAAL